MRRRDFITLLGGAATWPLATRAQQTITRMLRIGILMGQVGEQQSTVLEALETLGWIEGRTARIDLRQTSADAERVRMNARDLVALNPDVILVIGAVGTRAFQDLTRTLPVVFVNVADPVAGGFVASLAHPGGNLTGFSNFEFAIGGKWLDLLKEVAPGISRVALLSDPENVNQPRYARSILDVAPSRTLEITTVAVHNAGEIEAGITAFSAQLGGGLIVFPNAVTGRNAKTISDLAIRHRLPTIWAARSGVMEGGLMSYGPDLIDMYRRAVSYADRILRGEKPADLPVQQPTKFELVINLKTAKMLGLTVPLTLQAAADEVIE